MSNLREEFEKLPDIANILINSEFGFNENINQYFHPNHTEHRLSYAFLMGSWYAFQEQQKKLDAMCECMDEAIRLIDEGNSWDAKELLK